MEMDIPIANHLHRIMLECVFLHATFSGSLHKYLMLIELFLLNFRCNYYVMRATKNSKDYDLRNSGNSASSATVSGVQNAAAAGAAGSTLMTIPIQVGSANLSPRPALSKLFRHQAEVRPSKLNT